MAALLSKPIDQITDADIESLVTERVPEGERMEFKRELPVKKGASDPDPWMCGKGTIGRFGKNKLLKEVVSFANAYGGVLVLGIEEDDSVKPPVAKTICPIPSCEDLADRFRKIFRDRVEPKLPSCDIFAVVTSGKEDGVVVFRVPGRSRLAPHRIEKTLICPVRRSDQSEEMSMREIQDMTLNVTRGLERLAKKLKERGTRFDQEFERLRSPADAYGLRITAMPVGDDIRLQTICRPGSELVEGLNVPKVIVKRHVTGKKTVEVDGKWPTLGRYHRPSWIPRLRAVRWDQKSDDPPESRCHRYLELHCDGLVECGYLSLIEIGYQDSDEVYKAKLYSDCAVQELANVICWADTLRRYANAGGVEYALQVAVHVKSEEVPVLLGNLQRTGYRAKLSGGVTPMPRYALDDVSDAGALLCMLVHDLFNAGGRALSDDTVGRFEIQCEQG